MPSMDDASVASPLGLRTNTRPYKANPTANPNLMLHKHFNPDRDSNLLILGALDKGLEGSERCLIAHQLPKHRLGSGVSVRIMKTSQYGQVCMSRTHVCVKKTCKEA